MPCLPSPYHTGQSPSALMDSADLISASYYNQPHSVNHARMLVPICKDFTFSGLHNTAHLFASIILFFLNLQLLPCHSYDCLSLHAMMCSATQMDRPRIVYAVSCVWSIGAAKVGPFQVKFANSTPGKISSSQASAGAHYVQDLPLSLAKTHQSLWQGHTMFKICPSALPRRIVGVVQPNMLWNTWLLWCCC